jgi:hypothetical protein
MELLISMMIDVSVSAVRAQVTKVMSTPVSGSSEGCPVQHSGTQQQASTELQASNMSQGNVCAAFDGKLEVSSAPPVSHAAL